VSILWLGKGEGKRGFV